MNYYSYHIGDFRSGTFNMSRQERWIYRDMLDVYYDMEVPFPEDLDIVCKMIGVRSDDEKKIVDDILALKFELCADGYHHKRCDEEISAYKARADVAKNNGKKGGKQQKANQPQPIANPVGTQLVPTGHPGLTESRTNQEPITNNQEPITINQAQSAQLPVPVSLSIAFRAKGIRTQPADPRLIALAEQGITAELVNSACDAAKAAKPNETVGIGYILAILERWAKSAKNLQAGGAQVPGKSSQWWASDAGIIKKGEELNMIPRPGERMVDFKSRIQISIENHANPPNKIMNNAVETKEYKKKSCKPESMPPLVDFLK